jgi:hypothetical protein
MQELSGRDNPAQDSLRFLAFVNLRFLSSPVIGVHFFLSVNKCQDFDTLWVFIGLEWEDIAH